jgi:type VI protein secretion system component VasF
MNSLKLTATDDDVWFALQELEAAFVGLRQEAPVTAEQRARPELWSDYAARRHELSALIRALQQRLIAAFGSEAAYAERAFCAVLIHYDERELGWVDREKTELPMPLFQSTYCGVYNGGELFFTYLEDALRASSSPPLLLQLLLFCLRSGFCGRYLRVDDPERLEKDKELRKRVSAVLGGSERNPTPMPATLPIRGVAFPFTYYGIALAALACLWFGFRFVAAVEEKREYSEPCELW